MTQQTRWSQQLDNPPTSAIRPVAASRNRPRAELAQQPAAGTAYPVTTGSARRLVAEAAYDV